MKTILGRPKTKTVPDFFVSSLLGRADQEWLKQEAIRRGCTDVAALINTLIVAFMRRKPWVNPKNFRMVLTPASRCEGVVRYRYQLKVDLLPEIDDAITKVTFYQQWAASRSAFLYNVVVWAKLEREKQNAATVATLA